MWPRWRCAVDRAEEEEEDFFLFPSRNGISGRVGLAGCQVGFGQVSSPLLFSVLISFLFLPIFDFDFNYILLICFAGILSL
jgi:hypothetical protein